MTIDTHRRGTFGRGTFGRGALGAARGRQRACTPVTWPEAIARGWAVALAQCLMNKKPADKKENEKATGT